MYECDELSCVTGSPLTHVERQCNKVTQLPLGPLCLCCRLLHLWKHKVPWGFLWIWSAQWPAATHGLRCWHKCISLRFVSNLQCALCNTDSQYAVVKTWCVPYKHSVLKQGPWWEVWRSLAKIKGNRNKIVATKTHASPKQCSNAARHEETSIVLAVTNIAAECGMSDLLPKVGIYPSKSTSQDPNQTVLFIQFYQIYTLISWY